MKRSYLFGVFVLAMVLAAPNTMAADATRSAGHWDEETLELFGSIPIQEGGRIKPLSTFAAFRLLPLNSMRALRLEDGGKLTPLEWLLDCLFYPEAARDYKHFSVDNSDVVTNIGVTAHEKRDRYSYNDLLPGRAKLFQIAQQVSAKESKDRSGMETITLNLAHNMRSFELLAGFLEFTKIDFKVHGSPRLESVYPESEELALSTVLARHNELRAAIMDIRTDEEGVLAENQAEMKALAQFFTKLDNTTITAQSLSFFPLADPEKDEWASPATLVKQLFEPGGVDERDLEALASLERLGKTVENRLAFKQELKNFQQLIVSQARLRGEYSKVPLEIFFYNTQFFYYAQLLFVLAFLLVAVSWLNIGIGVMNKVTVVAVVIPWMILVAGIVVRCVVQGRPPVTTLYETILFLTAVAVFVALFIEYANRQRIGIAVAAFLGVLGVFMAGKYELSDKQDTMPSLVAVLDTNFWLATHVTMVMVGYSAGILAAGLAHVYVFGKLFKFKKGNDQFYRNITRMVYGTVCFGLLFSFVGTVLGGIWANYSWGRFWGWDPKENGAMMIVLCNLAILHARMGGYIRNMGIHLAAIGAGCVVAFSWWGVNLLGVGLHSYGFTSGIWSILSAFWVGEAFVVVLGFSILLRERSAKLAAVETRRKSAILDADIPGEPVTK